MEQIGVVAEHDKCGRTALGLGCKFDAERLALACEGLFELSILNQTVERASRESEIPAIDGSENGFHDAIHPF